MTNNPISKEPKYNLRFVIKETGLKADTLRAWERRYNLPSPQRTAGGHRLFSDYDVETIKWLIARQEEGVSIRLAVDLWRETLNKGQDPLGPSLTDQYTSADPIPEGGLEVLDNFKKRWLQACLNFDGVAADQVLNQAFAQFSLQTVCIGILQSGLSEIGNLWYQGEVSVQQEHFASELAVRRLHSLISAAPQPIQKGTVLVGCPQGENHTFSLLMITLLLRYRGWDIIYLGANVPKAQIEETIAKTKPDLVVMVAMQLVTAATLLDTALYLLEAKVPLAFGGRIFNLHPGLYQRIPGHYLGTELSGAIEIIENLLKGPFPNTEFVPGLNHYSQTVALFTEKVNEIETQTLNNLRGKWQNISEAALHNANAFLAQDITAALSLGDIHLLGSNMAWIKGLIENRDSNADLFQNYLAAYHDAVSLVLGEPGLPIVEGLNSFRTDKI
jgi:methanogenic corrinoid protein MtbC1